MSQADGFGRIGVLMGGNSSEREISLRSGRAVIEALRGKGASVVPLDLEGSPSQMRARLAEAAVDFAFIALHGKGGEDGTVQNLLAELGIPYIGSSPEGSARAFNKLESKKIFARSGIPTPQYAVARPSDSPGELARFPFPVFVKPIEEGSSIGVRKIDRLDQASEILGALFKEYDSLLVEEAILGKELTVGILGDQALPVIELRPKREFYDFTAKYTQGMTEYLIPAPITPALTRNVQDIAERAHRQLGLRDFSRIDFMLDPSGEPFVLEANTIPGFTETSLLPKAARQAGIEFGDLCLTLLELAKERSLSNGKKK